MDNQALQSDIEIAEALDEHLSKQSASIEDICGSLEALSQAIVMDEEPQELTEHQKEMVKAFRDASKDHKGEVYAVADAKALEDFQEITAAVARKAAMAFSIQIPQHFKITAKGLSHYAGMAHRLRERLLQLRPMLEKRDIPYTDVFDYGAYSRFFQINGKSIGGFSAFHDAMVVQNAATRYVLRAADSYGMVITQKLLKTLQGLQDTKKHNADTLFALRDAVAIQWEYTWKEAKITGDHGQTPQEALNEFPSRQFISLAPLLDNRYLLAHKPKAVGTENPAKIPSELKDYGATVVFAKKSEAQAQHSMNVPNVEDLLKLVDETVDILHDMQMLEVLAKKNNDLAKDFKKATDVLNKQLEGKASGELYGFIAEYFKMATVIGQNIQQPYVHMAWLYLRCAMVVVSLTELAAVEEPNKRIAAVRFFSKQSKEFTNPALESFQLTQKALKAVLRASIA